MAAKSRSIVTALTAAALAAVGFLTYQASASAPDHLTQVRSPGSSAAPTPGPSGAEHKDKDKDKGKTQHNTALPPNSGQGQRVVYALGAKRVWLVGADGKVTRTFQVAPSSVSPGPGTYTVSSRTEGPITGSDGVRVKHVVRFAYVDNTTVGFSAAVDGSTPDQKAGKKAGAVREAPADGAAMWDFALRSTKVVVVA